MVTIIGYEKLKNKEDEEFNVLILQGDIETVISKETGKPYFTARKTSIPCTFGDTMAESLVGAEMPDYKVFGLLSLVCIAFFYLPQTICTRGRLARSLTGNKI